MRGSACLSVCPKRNPDQFSRFSTAHGRRDQRTDRQTDTQTDKHTDHAAMATIGRILFSFYFTVILFYFIFSDAA